jgi:hypothetical protein
MTAALSFAQLSALAPSLGIYDVPCPLCSALHNPLRRTLRIWRERDDFMGYACARCAEKGWSRSGQGAAFPAHERLSAIQRETANRLCAERDKNRLKARWMWSASRPSKSQTPPFVYLREVRNYQGPIPFTLRYLPPRMIAAIGMAHEPSELRPGAYVIAEHALAAVHLTLLQPDGSGKAHDVENAKLIVGQGSAGSPICLVPSNDLLGLVITEGIEDALSMHEATGLGAWAAGCAGRMPALAHRVPAWMDCVTVVADADADGQRHSRKLYERLLDRGIHSERLTFDERRAAT